MTKKKSTFSVTVVSSSALHCSKEHRLEIRLKKLQVTWEFLSFPWLQWLILFLPCKVFALGTTMSQFKSTRCLILLGKNIVWLHSILDWNSKKKKSEVLLFMSFMPNYSVIWYGILPGLYCVISPLLKEVLRQRLWEQVCRAFLRSYLFFLM